MWLGQTLVDAEECIWQQWLSEVSSHSTALQQAIKARDAVLQLSVSIAFIGASSEQPKDWRVAKIIERGPNLVLTLFANFCLLFQEPRNCFLRKGVFARMYSSLGCRALSAKYTGESNIFRIVLVLLDKKLDSAESSKPPCENPLFLVPDFYALLKTCQKASKVVLTSFENCRRSDAATSRWPLFGLSSSTAHLDPLILPACTLKHWFLSFLLSV